MNKKGVTPVVGWTTIAGLLMVIAFLGGINYMDDDVYYCENRSIVMVCDSLSVYYNLSDGKCHNAKIGNKLCRSGWAEIVNDVFINETDTEEEVTPLESGVSHYLSDSFYWHCEGTLNESQCQSLGGMASYEELVDLNR